MGVPPVSASILPRSKQCKRSCTQAESIWRGRNGSPRPAALSSTSERAISSGLTRPIAFGVTRAIGPLNQTALEEIILPEDRERFRHQIAIVLEGRSEPVMEYRIRRA